MLCRQCILATALLSIWLFTPGCPAQQDEGQTWKGFVTSTSSAAPFEVNGLKVIISSETVFRLRVADGVASQTSATAKPYLGQSAEILGKIDRKKHTVTATKVILQDLQPREIEGEGVIETVAPAAPPTNKSSDERVVRVDGYLVLVSAKAAKSLGGPLPFQSGMWMTFHGRQGLDGTVEADKFTLDDNGISKREEKLLKKSDYDPGAVDENSKQSALSKAFRGIDPKQIPPYADPAMQERVEKIGMKLVPQYQRELPQTDEKKIDFQFQVIDLNKWRHDAHTLPNGIILVPRQVVERMQNDSQLATVLADNIACALEKQAYRAQPGATARSAVNIAGSAVGLVVPGLGLLTGDGTSIAAAKALRLSEEQSGRVSLFLLRDAGYDVKEAPVAWWLLASNKPKDLAEVSLPRRSAYLFETIFRGWPKQ